MYSPQPSVIAYRLPLYALSASLILFCGFYILWQQMFLQTEQGLITSSGNVWADWVVHMTHINTFNAWPLSDWLNHSPFISTLNFHYPLLANVFSALLVKIGMTLPKAMTFSSFILSVALVGSLFLFYKRLVHSWNWATLGVILFLFNGGLGFWYTFTQDLTSATHLPQYGLVIQNFIISEFVPQRAILFAAPFFVYSLTRLQNLIQQKPDTLDVKQASLIAVISNIILLSSMHTYLSLVILCVFTALQTHQHWRQWTLVAVLCGSSNLLIYALYYSVNDTSHFIEFRPGALIQFSQLTFSKFFLLNYGIVLPLFIFSFIRLKYWREPLVVSGVGLFMMAYLFKFQPWIWDNTKLLTWAHLLMLVPCVQMMQCLWQKRQVYRRLLALLCLITATLSGLHDCWQIIKPNRNLYTLYTPEEQDIAAAFQALSTHKTLSLTHMSHTNWVHALAARPVYSGYLSWLWSWGIDIEQIKQDSENMLNGDSARLKENNIKFIVIDIHHHPDEINPDFLSQFKLILSSPRFRVYATGY